MKYQNIYQGIFIERPNRFIAICQVEGKTEKVHVKNTGRCKELLIPGVTVFLELSDNPKRKTRYSLISVIKSGHIINMDSQVPNDVVYDAIKDGLIVGNTDLIKREKTYGDSRYDLYYEAGSRKGLVEVKGVTLEVDGIAMFPDAPTARGTKHVLGLMDALDAGYEAHIVFLVQMDYISSFRPNTERDPALTQALIRAYEAGVQIHVYDSKVDKDYISIGNLLAFEL